MAIRTGSNFAGRERVEGSPQFTRALELVQNVFAAAPDRARLNTVAAAFTPIVAWQAISDRVTVEIVFLRSRRTCTILALGQAAVPANVLLLALCDWLIFALALLAVEDLTLWAA